MLDSVARRRFRLVRQGIEIAALDWGGDGPLALLHHANGFCSGVFGLVARELSPRFRVVAFDARGHGDSSRPEGRGAYAWSAYVSDLCELAEQLLGESGRERVSLCLGHSFGGTIALTAAGRRPDLFARVIAVDPVIHRLGRNGEVVDSARGAELAEGARRRRHVFASRRAARERFLGRSTFSDWDPEAVELYLAEGLRERGDGRVELKCSGEVEAAIFSSSGSRELHAVAERVKAPVLLLRARRGDFPRDVYEGVAASLPDARVEDIDAGHFVPMEAPCLLCRAVLEFCK